jgi:hypothetical protein
MTAQWMETAAWHSSGRDVQRAACAVVKRSQARGVRPVSVQDGECVSEVVCVWGGAHSFCVYSPSVRSDGHGRDAFTAMFPSKDTLTSIVYEEVATRWQPATPHSLVFPTRERVRDAEGGGTVANCSLVINVCHLVLRGGARCGRFLLSPIWAGLLRQRHLERARFYPARLLQPLPQQQRLQCIYSRPVRPERAEARRVLHEKRVQRPAEQQCLHRRN